MSLHNAFHGALLKRMIRTWVVECTEGSTRTVALKAHVLSGLTTILPTHHHLCHTYATGTTHKNPCCLSACLPVGISSPSH